MFFNKKNDTSILSYFIKQSFVAILAVLTFSAINVYGEAYLPILIRQDNQQTHFISIPDFAFNEKSPIADLPEKYFERINSTAITISDEGDDENRSVDGGEDDEETTIPPDEEEVVVDEEPEVEEEVVEPEPESEPESEGGAEIEPESTE